ncbi:hypothetical protein FACS1894195_0340 [Bacteroidia bacterium]|nr:hypothetical protein FACS1894195_0340 [Bacteroidia bacterium]
MIEFKPITLEEKDLILHYTLPFAPYDCDFSFGNLVAWSFLSQSSFALIGDSLVIRCTLPDGSHFYHLPIGVEDKVGVIKQLDDYAGQKKEVLKLRGHQAELQDIMEKCLLGKFEYKSDRNYFDYIYLRQDLVDLSGKDYQAKRNHVNKFSKLNSYTYTPITPDILPYCMELETEWCKKRHCFEIDGLRYEYRAFCNAVEHFEALGMVGGAIWVNKEIVSFTMGTPVNHECFDIEFEKANTDIDGAYAIINREFAARLPQQYVYLNREEDMGLEGLRKAKLSYHPTFMVEKCLAVKTNPLEYV